MAQKIGNEPPQIVLNVDIKLDTPRLLAMLVTSEEHIKHIQAIQLLAANLDVIAARAVGN